jgi:YesN/AraC family two-component response regulator
VPDSSVLIVEDDVPVARLFGRILKQQGYEVQLVHCGSDAVAVAAQHRFGSVVCDLILPDVPGLQVLRQIRALPQCPAFILVTGAGSIQDGLEAARLGTLAILEKPITAQELINAVTNAITSRRSGQTLPAGGRPSSDARASFTASAATAFVESHYQRPGLKLADVAKHANISTWHCCRIIRQRHGMTFREYLAKLRVAKAQIALVSTTLSIKEIAFSVGYTNVASFCRQFREVAGHSATHWRQMHPSELRTKR